MSVVSSVLSSTGSSRWKINDRLASIMDSIFAIGAGLGVRFIVDAATHQNMKLTSSLIGLWEGVVLLHFLKKMPRSNDPYIAYGVRLFVDFLVTESVARFVVVLIWTGMGMVLADIGPALWDDAGVKQVWRRFRRDMRTVSKVIPTVAFFPPARTVRFSPSLAPTETMASDPPTPSAFTITEMTPTTNPSAPLPPTTTKFTTQTTPKRRVPGYFPSGFSDTDSLTSIGSPLPVGRRIPSGVDPTRTSRRLSVYPSHLDDSDASSQNENDLDEANLSSSTSDSDSTEIAAPSASGPIDTENIPEMDVEEEPPIQISTEPTKPEEEVDLTTPRSRPVQMPPTPSDSAARWDRDLREHEEPLGPRPKSEFLPQIPDFLDEPASEDWETIKKEDYTEEKELPPTPHEKDLPEGGQAQTMPAPGQAAGGAPSPEEEGWDTMQSQILDNDNDETKKANDTVESQDAIPTTNTHDQPPLNRDSLPPPYEDDPDDIYGDEAPPEKPAGTSNGANWLDQEEARLREEEEKERKLREEAEESSRKAALEEAERLEKVEEERKKAEEEAERLKNEAEAKAEAERLKAEEEEKRREKEEKRKKKEEVAERKRKEEADEAARRKKREEDAAAEAEKKRREEEAKLAEERKKAAEEAEARRQQAREEAEAKAAAEKKLQEDAAAERMRLEDEAEVTKKCLEDEAAEKQRLDDEAAAATASEAARVAAEEAGRQRLAEEENQRQQEEERQQRELQELQAAEAAVATALQAELADAGQPNRSNPTDRPANEAGNEQWRQDQQLPDPFSPTEPRDSQLPPPPPPESVASEASLAAVNVEDRLERMLLLRAQMVEIERRIEELKGQGQDTAGQEKVLRKMENKAQKRYGEGTSMAELIDGFDAVGEVSLDNMHPKRAQQKVEETLEQLLSPSARSLSLTITVARKPTEAKKQKPLIVKLLAAYNLTPYTTENADNKKISEINIPEENFAEWLTGYRTLLAKQQEQQEELYDPWG